MKPITKAIIPVAGMGTRMLPATKAIPKELLNVFDTPVLQLIVEELVQAGITDIIIVTHPGRKSGIQLHFEQNDFLEGKLKDKGKMELLEAVTKIHQMAEYQFVTQDEPLGTGHAVLQAMPFIDDSDEAVVVCFGDDIVENGDGPNAIEQMLEVYSEHKCPVYYAMEVPHADVVKYGVIAPDQSYVAGDKEVTLAGFVEKPETPDLAPSNLITIGKYIITRDVLDLLESQQAGVGGEINLPEAIERHRQEGNTVMARVMEGRRFDTGKKLGLVHAMVHWAYLHHPEEMKTMLQEYTQ